MRLIHCLLALSTLALASCGNCGGVDETIHTYAMAIENNEDSIGVTYGRYNDELWLIPLSWSEDGDRNCRYKNLVVNFGEKIDTNTLTVYCNEELMSNGKTVAVGENMLKRTDAFNIYGRMIELSLDTADVARQSITYYVKGSTDRGNNFTDSVVVYYK